jgi:lipopolysaccharide transport system ATP-binding protein
MAHSDVVIRVEGLGKKYALHHETSERYIALRDVIARQAKIAGRLLNPFTLAGQLRQSNRQAAQERFQSEEEFWALKNVSFEIARGERVGIIGRNGAGKSTLLKILSRITEPTTGRVEICGRVASLLEVGTGFHPELTGRENIYLNGAILGMTRREIRSKFDEIVAFAEVEKFLDTPVKRYSSGMYVRLAFAVAAHLEPEILVVDEVLAVGDASFQKKCLGKMEDVADREGRTILFVSHQMAAIQRLCKTCILLKSGKIQRIADATSTIEAYLRYEGDKDKPEILSSIHRKGTGELRVEKIELLASTDSAIDVAISGKDLIIELAYVAKDDKPLDLSRIICSIQVLDHLGDPLFLTHNRMTGHCFIGQSRRGVIRLLLYKLPLPAGEYAISYSLIKDGQYLDAISAAKRLRVEAGDFFGTGEIPPSSHGKVLVQSEWSSIDRSLRPKQL